MRPIDLSVSFANAIADLAKEKKKVRKIERAKVRDVAEKDGPLDEVAAEIYQPGPELVRVCDLAIALERPLLLQGEPGCGKTRLAHSLAYALRLPLEVAYVKSTSRAQDLLYTYDAVRRLYDSQLGDKGPKDADGEAAVRDAGNYVEYGPLGRAIARAAYGRRSVVLIDEIDKADLDFPNDLLWELDRMEFEVPEAPHRSRSAKEARPIVVITHNEEKPLPPAFLRRCVYHYVEFPRDRSEVEAILKLHDVKDSTLRSTAAELIEKMRSMDLTKKPGLAELIEWVSYEQARGTTAEGLAKLENVEVVIKDHNDQLRVRKDIASS